MIDRTTVPDNPMLLIEDLEKRQARALRDALLRADMTVLQQIDDDIAWLRTMLNG